MRTCDDYEILIQLQLDGMLDPSESSDLSAHLAACPACREKLAQYQRMKDAMALLGDEPAPTGLHDAILSHVFAHVESSAEARSAKTKRFPSWALKTVAGVAACAVIAFAAVHMMPRMGSADKNAAAPMAPEAYSSAEPQQTDDALSPNLATAPSDVPQESTGSDPGRKSIGKAPLDPESASLWAETAKNGVLQDAGLVNGYLAVGEEKALPAWIDKSSLSSIDEADGADYTRVAANQEEEWVSALEENGFALYMLEVGDESSEEPAAAGETDGADESVLFVFQWEKTE